MRTARKEMEDIMTAIAKQCSASGHLTQDGWPCDTFEMLENIGVLSGPSLQDCTEHPHPRGESSDGQRLPTPPPCLQLDPNSSQSIDPCYKRDFTEDTSSELGDKKRALSSQLIKKPRTHEVRLSFIL